MAEKNKATLFADAGAANRWGTNTPGGITGTVHLAILQDILDSMLSSLDDVVPQAEAEAGAATTPRLWTAERVAQAIAALGATLPDTVAQAEAEAGAATTARLWTAERVAQAIAALGATLPDTVAQAEAEAGAATTARLWTAERVAQAIAALGATLPDTVAQAEAEAGAATTARLWTAERVAQAIAALGAANQSAPLATAGTAVTLDLAGGRYYGTDAAPLTGAVTLDLTGAVAFGFAVVYYQGATDPLASIVNNLTVKSFGYLFTPNKLVKIVIRREPGGLVTVFSEQADANQAPIVTGFTISGTEEVGQTLQLAYTYADAEGDTEDTGVGGSEFRVIRYASVVDYNADTNRTIAAAAADTQGSPVQYVIQAGDENGYLAFEVLVRASTGEETSGAWYRSDRTDQIQAAGANFDVVALNWNVLLDTPITGAAGSSIVGGDVQAWGDRSGNVNHFSATNTTWRPDLITDANGQEAADFSALGRRLQSAADPTVDISGGDWVVYWLGKINAQASGIGMMLSRSGSVSGDGLLITSDPGAADPAVAADLKVFSDVGVTVQDYYGDSLPIAENFLLKVRCVGGDLDVFVQEAGGSLVQVGSTLSGRVIPGTYTGNPMYIDLTRTLNGQLQFLGVKQGTLTAQDQTDLEAYLATKFAL